VARPLGLPVEEAAAAVLALATEKMVGAIDEITVNQGIDPAAAVLVGGGGAAGLNAVAVARRLGCAGVLIPEAGAVLSAAGALMSELSADYAQMLFTTSQRFDEAGVNAVLAALESRCRAFADGPGEGALETTIEFSVEARYPHQIWEIEVPLGAGRIEGADALAAIKSIFHDTHKAIFEISDPKSEVEFVTWRAKVRCRLRAGEAGTRPATRTAPSSRRAGGSIWQARAGSRGGSPASRRCRPASRCRGRPSSNRRSRPSWSIPARSR
jgi:N-methylhydantoinase A